jgi:ankyrin repeat protein
VARTNGEPCGASGVLSRRPQLKRVLGGPRTCSAGVNSMTNEERLHHACAQGLMAEVRRLLRELPPPDLSWRSPVTGWTALHAAAENSHPDAIRALVAAGASVHALDDRGWTPLHWAVDAEIDKAVQHGGVPDLRTTQCLLDCGADPHAAAPDGSTPMSIATRYRCKPAIEELSKGRPTRR